MSTRPHLEGAPSRPVGGGGIFGVGLRRAAPRHTRVPPPPFLLPPGVLLCETDCEAQRTWQDTEKSSDMEWAFYYYSGLAISMAREFK